MKAKERIEFFNNLLPHIGHNIDIVGYAYNKERNFLYDSEEDIENVTVECLDCNVVLLEFDNE